MIRRRVLDPVLAVVLVTGAARTSAHAWEASFDEALLCGPAAPIASFPPRSTAPWTEAFSFAAWDARLEPDPLAPLCPPSLFEGESGTSAPGDALLRRAWGLASELAAEGRFEEASLQLQVVERALPEIADRVAWRRARLAREAGRFDEALQALRSVLRGPCSALRVRAEVLRVELLLRSGDARGLAAFRRLRMRYPRLSREPDLWLARAEWLREARRPVHAGYVLRRLRRDFPTSRAARRAESLLDVLREEGVSVAPFSVEDRIVRSERLLAAGARAWAEREVRAILKGRDVPSNVQRIRLLRMLARLARWRANWAEQLSHLEAARRLLAVVEDLPPEERAELSKAWHEAKRFDAGRRFRAAERLERLRRGRGWRRIPLFRLARAVSIAAAAGLREPLEALLEEMRRREAPPRIRLRALLEAVGVVEDARLVEWLADLVERPGLLGVRARYHRARALERLGRWREAEAGYSVLREVGGFYALWAEQRIGVTRRAAFEEGVEPSRLLAEVERDALTVDRAGRFPRSGFETGPSEAFALAEVSGREDRRTDAARTPFTEALPVDASREATWREVATALQEMADRHGDAFPWLRRAAALLLLGERESAGEELQEALLAWRQAVGRPIAFAGLESIYRGGARGRIRQSWALRRARAALPRDAKERLGRLAERLGEAGIAAGFLGAEYVASRPRPYAREVWAAARRHGLDPALLWAVMRVESVYRRRIVSYAGAIGLMQIMPATGRAIAWHRGREDFVPEDLLDPATNLDFAAWYLRSLLDRFEGRLPLAIAAYNGGPHNVRRWMRERPANMPLDAWLEHIPFGQTWRYVRRVLGHYAAYRVQLGLPMPRLAVSMPEARPDEVGF